MIAETVTGMATMGGLSATLGALLSLVGKGVGMWGESKRLSHARSLEELKVLSKMKDDAGKRGGKGGVFVRRFIVISLFGFLFGLLSINGILGHWFEQIPATYAYMEDVPSRWFGLIRAKQTLQTVPLAGIPVFQQAVEMVWLVGSFYFGSTRIK